MDPDFFSLTCMDPDGGLAQRRYIGMHVCVRVHACMH